MLHDTNDQPCITPRLHGLAWAQGGAHGLHGARVVVRRQVAHKQRGPPLVVRIVPERAQCISSSGLISKMVRRHVAHKQLQPPFIIRIVPEAATASLLSSNHQAFA